MKVYQNILQKLPIPIIAIDTNGKILLANNATISLFFAPHEKVYKTNINSIFNEDTTTYILSLLKLDDAVNMAPVSFELDEQEYSVQVERFERNSAIKGGILVLSPTKLKA